MSVGRGEAPWERAQCALGMARHETTAQQQLVQSQVGSHMDIRVSMGKCLVRGVDIQRECLTTASDDDLICVACLHILQKFDWHVPQMRAKPSGVRIAWFQYQFFFWHVADLLGDLPMPHYNHDKNFAINISMV